MDAKYIEQHNIIERYVLRQLDEQEQQDFELYYLEHPEVLDEIERVRALKSGLVELATEESTSINQASSEVGGRRKAGSSLDSILAFLRSPVPLTTSYALAAVLLGTVLFPLLTSDAPSLLAPKAVKVVQYRSADKLKPKLMEISLKPGERQVLLTVEVSSPGTYKVKLVNEAEKPITRVVTATAVRQEFTVVLELPHEPKADQQLVLQVHNAQGRLETSRRLNLTRES